ncbi:MAG: hypothetical protein ABI895_28875 [Deltaproteobacteria bacterium]
MNYQKVCVGLAAVSLACGIGCTLEEVDSDAIRTKGLYAEMLAIAPGNGTTLVRVNLTVGGNSGTRVQLVGEDVLVAEPDEDTRVALARQGHGRYEETLEGEASREVTVRLERGAEDAPAEGTAFLPPAFAMQLESPMAGGVDRSTPVMVGWQDPSVEATNMDWSVEGDCIWSDSGVTPDDGVMTLNPEHVRVKSTQAGEECVVQLTLDRATTNGVDPLFVPGSNFRAVQRRAVTFVSTPAVGEKNGPEAAAASATAED